MARINLLPWRDNLRKKRQRDFVTLTLLAVLVTGAACGGAHFYVEELINHQNQRNGLLKREIAIVDKKIKEIKELEATKAKLIARMDVIQSLQSSRPEIVHLFDELVSTIPEGTHLVKLVQSANAITLDGKAQSNARVSAYMRNIDASLWLGNPELQVVSTKEKTSAVALSEFTLKAKQISAKDKEGDK